MAGLVAGLVPGLMVHAFIAFAFVVTALPMAANAGNGIVSFKPGALKAAVKNGETILLDYKATW